MFGVFGEKGQRRATLNVTRTLDGGACINQRSLRLALSVFSPQTAQDAGGKALAASDLLEALWVLELAIVAKTLSFDGTLPQSEVDALRGDAGALFDACNFGDDFVVAVKPASHSEQENFASAAAMKALDDLGFLGDGGGGGGFAPTHGLDEALKPEEGDAFYAKLKALHDGARIEGAAASSDEIAALLDDGSRFRGSKCIAGLALLGKPALARALNVPEKFAIATPLAAASLINRFRFTYIRSLAYSVRDEYVPANRWRQLSEYHSITFADVVRKSFAQRYTRTLERELGGTDQQFTVALPPIGLYALMTAPEGAGPRGVLEHAHDVFSDYGAAFRKFWSYTREIEPPKQGWTAATGDPHLDRESSRIEKALTEKLGRLKKLAKRGYSSTLDRITTPIVSGGSAAAGALLGTALAGPVGTVAGSALGAVAGEMIKQFYGVAGDSVRAHVDDYRKLDDELFRTYAGDLKLSALEDRVEKVLGRALQRPA